MTVKLYGWVPPPPELEAWAGEQIAGVLGCGAWGCALRLADDRVLKVTRDDDEVAAISAVEDARAAGKRTA